MLSSVTEYDINLVNWVNFSFIRYLNSIVGRSTRSVKSTLGPSLNSTRLRPQTIDSVDQLDQFRGLIGTLYPYFYSLSFIVVYTQLCNHYRIVAENSVNYVSPDHQIAFTFYQI